MTSPRRRVFIDVAQVKAQLKVFWSFGAFGGASINFFVHLVQMIRHYQQQDNINKARKIYPRNMKTSKYLV